MQYVRGLENYSEGRKSAVTFGKFDGLHKGHQLLVNTVKRLGVQSHSASVVCAFDMNARQILMTREEMGVHLDKEVDYLVDCPFTKEFREIEAEDFIRDIIKGVFHASFVVVGTDFQFGHDKRGDVHMLKAYEQECGYELFVIEKARWKNRVISSTYVKEVLREGNMKLVSTLLGYDYGVCGIVEHGRKLGRTLGFPTFNLSWPDQKIVPPKGVYFCHVYTEGEKYEGIANIGVKPTVSNENRIGIESYLFGYEGEAYGKKVRIELLDYTRPEQRFSGIDELKDCVQRDIASGRAYFGMRG